MADEMRAATPSGPAALEEDRLRAIARDLSSLFEGEVRFGRHDRMLYATDASMYQVEPIGVVIPRSISDVEAVVAYCGGNNLPILPRAGGTSLAGQAVNAWYWRADQTSARNVVAEGLGTSRSVDDDRVRARGVWKEGRWRVVIAGALRVESPEPLAQLRPGESSGFGVAVWDGGSGERAGIKSFSGPQWIDLDIDGATEARR